MLEKIKTFSELMPLEDNIYWLDPRDGRPTESMVYSIEPLNKPGFSNYIQLRYFKQTSGIDVPKDKLILAGEHGEFEVYKELWVPYNATNVITKTSVPTVVYTNLNELIKWMGLEKPKLKS